MPSTALDHELQRRFRQQESVARLGELALTGVDHEELVRALVELVHTELDADIVGFLQYDDAGFVRALAGIGWPDHLAHDGRLMPLVPGGLTERALHEGIPMFVDDTSIYLEQSPILAELDIAASLIVPIIDDGPIGTIGVHRFQSGGFDRHDAAFVSSLCTVVAVAHRRREAESVMRHRALHDHLTGLPNRLLLRDRLDHALERRRRSGAGCALLLVDLDGFKLVNDTMGHAVGDLILRQVARRFASSVRASDTVARLGGDEFALVLEDLTFDRADEIAHHVRASLEAPVVVDGMGLHVDASIGVAVADDGAEDADELLRRADVAMYAAKASGAGVERYRSGRDQTMRSRIRWAAEVQDAVDARHFELHFEPQLRLDSGAVTAVEGLLRWAHPERGLICADEFLPVIEATQTIIPLSRWMLREALSQLAAWRNDGLALTVALDVSARWLRHPDMVAEVLRALADTDVPADGLVVEITEQSLASDPGRTETAVRQLVAAGIGVSIDDFGVSHSSLLRLGTLPTAQLKIAPTLLRSLQDDEVETGRARALVETVIELGRRLDSDVAATGVQSAEELSVIRDLGCPTAQGPYLAPAVPAPALPDLIASLAAPTR